MWLDEHGFLNMYESNLFEFDINREIVTCSKTDSQEIRLSYYYTFKLNKQLKNKSSIIWNLVFFPVHLYRLLIRRCWYVLWYAARTWKNVPARIFPPVPTASESKTTWRARIASFSFLDCDFKKKKTFQIRHRSLGPIARLSTVLLYDWDRSARFLTPEKSQIAEKRNDRDKTPCCKIRRARVPNTVRYTLVRCYNV